MKFNSERRTRNPWPSTVSARTEAQLSAEPPMGEGSERTRFSPALAGESAPRWISETVMRRPDSGWRMESLDHRLRIRDCRSRRPDPSQTEWVRLESGQKPKEISDGYGPTEVSPTPYSAP